MPDSVPVDVEHLRRLGGEFRESATELRDRIDRFRADAGDTPGTSEADRAYRDTASRTLEQLERLHRDLAATAQALEAHAETARNGG